MTDLLGKRVLIAGATGYLGKFAVQAFKRAGYHVRVLTRSEERLYEAGPFTAPGLVFSCVGISRQRDGLRFEQVDYQCNKNLIGLCEQANVCRFTYISLQGAESTMDLAIVQAQACLPGG